MICIASLIAFCAFVYNGGSWTVTRKWQSIESVSINKTDFQVYETLEATVKKDDLYYAAMYMDGNHVTSGYAGSDGEVVLSKTFDTGDVGKHIVTILIYYDGGSNSTRWSSTISVL